MVTTDPHRPLDRASQLFPDERLATTEALLSTQGAVAAVLSKRAVEPARLDPATADLLVRLMKSSPEGLRGVDIGRHCHMSATRVSRLIDRAEAAGLVERQPDAHDRRAQQVAITALGENTASAYAPLLDQVLEELIFDTLDGDERTTLIRLLDRVRQRATELLET